MWAKKMQSMIEPLSMEVIGSASILAKWQGISLREYIEQGLMAVFADDLKYVNVLKPGEIDLRSDWGKLAPIERLALDELIQVCQEFWAEEQRIKFGAKK